MNLMIVKDGPGQASAYSAELMAGCSGYPAAEEFVAAYRDNERLAVEIARLVGEPFDQEKGANAATVLKERLVANGHAVNATFSGTPKPKVSQTFEGLLRTGQAAVLAQVSRLPTARKAMTTAAMAMASTVLMSFGTAPEAQAADLGRYAKDSIGGIIGGAIMHNFGKGKGKTALTALGVAAGVAIAEEMQKPRNPQSNYSPGSGFYQPSVGGMGGTEQLPLEIMSKMSAQQTNVLMLRDQYARALYIAQMAEDNRVVDPQNKALVEAATLAKSMARAPEQRYAQVRSDFAAAYEHLARRGYDMHDFAYTYSVLQKPITARDMNPQDMSGVQAQHQRPQTTQEFSWPGGGA